jgi:AraC-like DNA-binding protein
MDPRPYWTKHEDGAFVSAAVRVDAQRYFISIRIELHYGEQLRTAASLCHQPAYGASESAFGKPARTVTEIGALVGFVETSSFTAAFRRVTAMTPTDYRRHSD